MAAYHPPLAAVQAASRNAGGQLPLSDPAEVGARNDRMLEDPDAQVAAFDWVCGYDVESAFAEGWASSPQTR